MITREMTIGEIIRKFPQTISVFKKFGLECNECQIAQYEAIEGGADVHKVDVEGLLEELNRVIEE
ncbi:hybrid cluster-associated redox disulfide protein [Geothermobacter ehrlichii]|uniref:Hybrid cluster-associated redox disulfide protein n=1 Tax=Geothermobacter ehrlichii TaxID=213224 RepID=A0A5D3WMA6_9BACT|nr:DUF1858 domain-containing protein [Geothermobacter ehrlichii]TYP00306.1 hybrid cluster-associated redox disulfide protein [Geothermobacter ehrlichii]